MKEGDGKVFNKADWSSCRPLPCLTQSGYTSGVQSSADGRGKEWRNDGDMAGEGCRASNGKPPPPRSNDQQKIALPMVGNTRPKPLGKTAFLR